MIKLVNRAGAEIRVSSDEQAKFWERFGYRAPAKPKRQTKAKQSDDSTD